MYVNSAVGAGIFDKVEWITE